MNPVIKIIAKIHTAVYQLSRGRLGNSMGGNNILLLHHVGARSGKKYTSPLAYIEDVEEHSGAYAVIAAALGQPEHPGWYYNLKKNPDTTIEIRGQQMRVQAEVADPATRDKLWAEISAEFPQFTEYQNKTSRLIPIILLHPQTTR